VPAPHDAAPTRAVLLDVEGTTTPIAFVHDVLFPFARARLREFLDRECDDPEVAAHVEALRRQRDADAAAGAGAPAWRETSARERAESAAAYAAWLMDRDSKLTVLKALQGRIWQAGYERGELRGEVYADVARAFRRWHAQGRRVAIFSSGSVLGQRLLFGHSTAGDLTPCIDACFDTTTGPKREAASYRRIAASLEVAPAEVLFVSDVVAELDAALDAGLQTALCLRPGTERAPGAGHAAVGSFDGLLA
jgi:enolase-phosphatase E1